MPILGRSGIMCATTLNPASFDSWKDSHTARTVWPLEKKIWKRSNVETGLGWFYQNKNKCSDVFSLADILTCWCLWPHLRKHSARRSPAGCSRSSACHWGDASGSSLAASLWWFPRTWCCCAPSTCSERGAAVGVNTGWVGFSRGASWDYFAKRLSSCNDFLICPFDANENKYLRVGREQRIYWRHHLATSICVL